MCTKPCRSPSLAPMREIQDCMPFVARSRETWRPHIHLDVTDNAGPLTKTDRRSPPYGHSFALELYSDIDRRKGVPSLSHERQGVERVLQLTRNSEVASD